MGYDCYSLSHELSMFCVIYDSSLLEVLVRDTRVGC